MRAKIIHNRARSEAYFEERCLITELSNCQDDEAVSIARARVTPGVTTKLHRLRDVAERYLILEGEARVEIGDLPTEEVGPGDVVLIPPGCPQRISNVGHRDLVFLAICTPRFAPDKYEDLGARPIG